MSDEVKVGEAVLHSILGNTAIYIKYLMSNTPERAFWCLQPFQGFLLLENAKKIATNVLFANMINPGTYVN